MQKNLLTKLSGVVLLLLTFTVNAQTTFTNGASITMPTSGAATTYPSSLNVSGLSGNISKITLTFNGFSHSFPDDLGILLVSPTGAAFEVFSGVTDGEEMTNITFTIDDAATATLPDDAAVTGGSYKPAAYYNDLNGFPAPAPGTFNQPQAIGTATLASTFNGLNANGSWQLFIVDFEAGDGGSISGGWSLNITTGALPVKLSNFTGKTINNQNQLSWTTLTESNSKVFELQKSKDGVNFSTITSINSKAVNGNSSSPLNYSFTDVDITKGNSYYRIKQIDLDGKTELSKAILLTVRYKGNSAFVITSITKSAMVLQFNNLQQEKYNIKLIDMSGKQVVNKSYTATEGVSNFILSTYNLQSGIYTIIATDSKGQISAQKVLKQ